MMAIFAKIKYNTGLFVFLLFISTLNLSGQVGFGLHGGVNVNKAGFNPERNSFEASSQGINGGLTFRYISQPHCGILSELNYEQKGWKEKRLIIDPIIGDTTYSYREIASEYIQLPIFSHFYFGKNNSRIFLNIGSYVSYFLNYKEISPFESREENFNKFEFGLILGLGYEQKTRFGSFIIEPRFSHGFTSLLKKELDIAAYYSRYRIFSCSFTWLYELKGKKDVLK